MTVLLCGGALTVGCEARLGTPAQHFDHGEAERTVDLITVTEEWERDGEHVVSPVLEAPDGASRVGALVVLGDATAALPAIEARLVDDSGTPLGAWAPLATTWSEEDHHVAVAELGGIGSGAQLRMPAYDARAIRSLRWSATIPEEGAEPAADVESTRAALRSELHGLGIVTRESWGARSTRCTSGDAAKSRMAIHYTVTGSEDATRQVRAIQRYHMDGRGWCDVGYHFLVGVDGTIYEGRPLHLLGAHAYRNNTGNIGISFVGCFHPGSACAGFPPQTPPEAMIRQGGRLLGTLSRLYGIELSRTRVKGHRDHSSASTNCPGDYLYARIDDMLAIGRTSTLSGDGEPEEPEDPEPTDPEPMDPPDPSACASLSCGTCEATPGCGWCASRGACAAEGSGCAWHGAVADDACWDTLWPCWLASCWNPTASLGSCTGWTQYEDFSSGRYSVHRYSARLEAGTTTIRLERTAGTFAPALIVSDHAGRPIAGGEVASLHPDVRVTAATSGRAGSVAEVTLSASRALDVSIHVTGWHVLDDGFRGSMPTSSRYRLTATRACP